MTMGYATLTGTKDTDGSIKQWVNDSTVPSAVVVAQAEDLIYRRLRVRQMATLATGTIATDDYRLALATVAPRYLGLISFRRTGTTAGRIHYLNEAHFEERYATDSDGAIYAGIPTECCIDGTYINFNVKADADYPYRLRYYARPARLADDNDTNFLTDDFSDLLLAACLYRAYDFKKDFGARDTQLQIAMAAIDAANVLTDIENQEIEYSLHWNQPQ